jgi:hypothetical protein
MLRLHYINTILKHVLTHPRDFSISLNLFPSVLKMEGEWSSETAAPTYNNTRCQIPEDYNLNEPTGS